MKKNMTISVELSLEQVQFFRDFLWEHIAEASEKTFDLPPEEGNMKMDAYRSILQAFEEPVQAKMRELARNVQLLDMSGF